MKKRLFAIMLALVMLLAAVPALAEEGDGGKALETAAKITCKVCEEEVEGEDPQLLVLIHRLCYIQISTRSYSSEPRISVGHHH